jgi:integrase
VRGSIVKRGAGYSIVYRAPDPATGRTKQVWKAGYRTWREAEAALKEVVSQVDAGAYARPTKQTLGQYLQDDWIPSLDASVIGGSLKASTAFFYRNLATSYVVPRIGGVMLNRLDAPLLNKLYGDLLARGGRNGRSLSTTTVHGVHLTLSRALKDAVRWGKLSRNVVSLADPPQAAKPDKDIWDAEQLRAFASSVAADRLYALWRLAMTTGMRRGELAGLRWVDLDLETGKLTIRATRISVNYKVIDATPKLKSSVRVIGLDPTTVQALKGRRRGQLEERVAWGSAWTDSGLVFTREDGLGLHPERLTRLFQAAARRVGLPVIPLHGLRHSYATAGLEAGVSMKVMSERLGHSSLAITGDLYSHVREQVDQEAAAKTADYIFGLSDGR